MKSVVRIGSPDEPDGVWLPKPKRPLRRSTTTPFRRKCRALEPQDCLVCANCRSTKSLHSGTVDAFKQVGTREIKKVPALREKRW
jgi:hypothetical protein